MLQLLLLSGLNLWGQLRRTCGSMRRLGRSEDAVADSKATSLFMFYMSWERGVHTEEEK